MKRATTSASNIFRRAVCPASAVLEEGIAEKDSEFSKEGQMLHPLFLTGQRPEHLTLEQRGSLNIADSLADEFFAHLRNLYGIPVDAEYYDEREVPLVLRDETGEIAFPGHADVVRTWPAYSVRAIVDAKFGYKETPHAADNLQLASYACMKQQEAPVKFTGVQIVQPRNFGPRSSQAVYDGTGIERATVELLKINRAAQEPNGIAVAGEKQCHYCKAKTKCPAYTAKYLGIESASQTAIATVSHRQLVAMWEAIKFADKIGDEVRDELRARVERGEIPGLKLQNTGDTVYLHNVYGLFKALQDYFGPEDKTLAKDFDACRKLQMGEFTELVMARLKTTEKLAKQFIENMLLPFVTKAPKAKSVVFDKTTPLLLE